MQPLTHLHKEETVLGSFFNHLATFSYDRARDLLEKEREGFCKGVVSRWSQLLSVLIQLSTAEKQYINLSFLQPRGFLRKDSSVRSLYDGLLVEVERLSDCNEAVEAEDTVHQVAVDLAILLKGRVKGMDVYERLGTNAKPANFTELQGIVRSISTTSKDVHSAPVTAWKNVFYIEVGILYDFLSMSVSLSVLDFYASITALQALADKLTSWTELVQNREARKLSFASSLLRGVSGQSDPHLFQWFSRLRAALLSKFSLYFYQVLAKQTSVSDMRALSSKLLVDQSARLIWFHRRTDAANVSIVFDATGLPGFRGPGYHTQVEKKDSSVLTGLDLFPSIFSHPSHPIQQWPNIVMILTDKDYELAQDRIVYIHDGGIGVTYFLQMIEPRFTLVAMFDGRRSERDAVINGFFDEITQQLRLSKVLAALKPGTK